MGSGGLALSSFRSIQSVLTHGTAVVNAVGDAKGRKGAGAGGTTTMQGICMILTGCAHGFEDQNRE